MGKPEEQEWRIIDFSEHLMQKHRGNKGLSQPRDGTEKAASNLEGV